MTVPHMLPAAVRSASASATLTFSKLNTVLVVSLCTLRGRRRRRPRNTRYRAGATPYPDRTSTGWIAPASPGAHERGRDPLAGEPAFAVVRDRSGVVGVPSSWRRVGLPEWGR